MHMSMSISIWLVSLAVGFSPGESEFRQSRRTGRRPLRNSGVKGSFTEGGAMAEDGSILFSDIGDRIMRFDPKTNKTTVFREPSGRANGMIFDNKGRLIVAEGANTGGGRRVSITEPDGTIRTLADSYDEKRFNSPNDVAVDRQGRVYVSDPRYVGNEPRELDFEGVFLISLEGFVIPMITNAYKPNGLAISPDGKTLYVSDNGSRRRALLAADLGPDGKAANPRVIHDFGAGRGIDGMTVTTDGRIVAAAGAGNQRRRPRPLTDRQTRGPHPRPRTTRQRRIRRRRPQDPLHLRRQKPLPHQDHHDRLSRVAPW